MIKNIVFDMGNVLMRWNPEEFSLRFFENQQDAVLVCEKMFAGPEWHALDGGTIEEPAALTQILTALPERLHPAATALFEQWHEHFYPIPEMNTLAQQLKEKGLGVYLLSNAGVRFETFARQIPALKYIDGVVVSAYYKQLKPHRAIYETLFSTFHLTPAECFFIDDLPENIIGSRAVGMEGYLFDGDVEKLYAALLDNGVTL